MHEGSRVSTLQAAGYPWADMHAGSSVSTVLAYQGGDYRADGGAAWAIVTNDEFLPQETAQKAGMGGA